MIFFFEFAHCILRIYLLPIFLQEWCNTIVLRLGTHCIGSENTVYALCLYLLLIPTLIIDVSYLHMFWRVQCQDGVVNDELGDAPKIAMFAFFQNVNPQVAWCKWVKCKKKRGEGDKFWSYRISVVEVPNLQGCYVVHTGKQLRTFRRKERNAFLFSSKHSC